MMIVDKFIHILFLYAQWFHNMQHIVLKVCTSALSFHFLLLSHLGTVVAIGLKNEICGETKLTQLYCQYPSTKGAETTRDIPLFPVSP